MLLNTLPSYYIGMVSLFFSVRQLSFFTASFFHRLINLISIRSSTSPSYLSHGTIISYLIYPPDSVYSSYVTLYVYLFFFLGTLVIQQRRFLIPTRQFTFYFYFILFGIQFSTPYFEEWFIKSIVLVRLFFVCPLLCLQFTIS